MLQAFEATRVEVAAEQAAKDPDFERVWQSPSRFRDQYAVWRGLSTVGVGTGRTGGDLSRAPPSAGRRGSPSAR